MRVVTAPVTAMSTLGPSRPRRIGTVQLCHSSACLGLLEHGNDLAIEKSGFFHGTASGEIARKFHV